MSNWSFWGKLLAIAGACVTLLTLADLIKKLFLSGAKPQILLDKNERLIRILSDKQEVSFKLYVDNTKGNKDCSIKSVELSWDGGVINDFRYEPSSSLSVPSGREEFFMVFGRGDKPDGFKVQSEQKTAEAVVSVKFHNVKKPIKKKFTFTLIIIHP